jgi:glycogen(starch) synthase
MHICFVSTPYPPETDFGGIATYAHTAARILARRGHKVSVVTVTWGKEDIHRVTDGVEVWQIREPGSRTTVQDDLRRNRQVWQALQELKPDVVQVAEYEGECFLSSLLRRKRFGLVTRLTCHFTLTSVRHQYPFEMQRFARHYMALEQARHSDAIFSPAVSHARQIEQDSGFKPGTIRQIYNSLNLEDMQAFRRMEPELKISGPYLIYFGRLEAESKGILYLVEALQTVWEKSPYLKMVFAGLYDGYKVKGEPVKVYIERKAGKYAGNLIFTGHLHRHQVLPLVARAGAAVLPSVWEPFGFTCAEALAMGVPLVTTSDSGGPAEIVAGKHDPEVASDSTPAGWLVPRRNPKALASAIIEVLSDEEARAQTLERAERRVRRFDAERMVDRLEELYQEVCAKL